MNDSIHPVQGRKLWEKRVPIQRVHVKSPIVSRKFFADVILNDITDCGWETRDDKEICVVDGKLGQQDYHRDTEVDARPSLAKGMGPTSTSTFEA